MSARYPKGSKATATIQGRLKAVSIDESSATIKISRPTPSGASRTTLEYKVTPGFAGLVAKFVGHDVKFVLTLFDEGEAHAD